MILLADDVIEFVGERGDVVAFARVQAGSDRTSGRGARVLLGARNLLRRSPRVVRLLTLLLGNVQSLRDRRLPLPDRWRRRASMEALYWNDALSTPSGRERFSERLDASTPVRSPALRRALSEIPSRHVAIIDVGSGPLSSVGGAFPGKDLRVVATDPLADEYLRMLRQNGIEPRVPPISCSGEHLVERFGRETFDVAFASNSLDHTADPVTVLKNMLALIKPEGRVALVHLRNEGERNAYSGIHFWNVDCSDGDLVFWRGTSHYNVAEDLDGHFDVECWTGENDRIHSVIRPRR